MRCCAEAAPTQLPPARRTALCAGSGGSTTESSSTSQLTKFRGLGSRLVVLWAEGINYFGFKRDSATSKQVWQLWLLFEVLPKPEQTIASDFRCVVERSTAPPCEPSDIAIYKDIYIYI